MIGWFLSKAVPWQMRRQTYPEQGEPSAADVTSEVLENFLAAAELGFQGADQDTLKAREQSVPWNRRPFYWEGHAFGVSGRLASTFSKRITDEEYHAPGFRFMLYTGLGVWNGLAAAMHGPQVTLKPERWAAVPDMQANRALIAGGAAFSVVAVNGKLHRPSLEILGKGYDANYARGIWQGAGRAAWFLYMRSPERIAKMLQELEDVVEPVAEGVGLAITYTQLGEPHRIVEQIEALPKRWAKSLRAGSRLCLAAAASDDPRIVSNIEALPEPLATWYSQGAQALQDAGRGPDMAERLLERFYSLA